jgi:hypothetical protein
VYVRKLQSAALTYLSDMPAFTQGYKPITVWCLVFSILYVDAVLAALAFLNEFVFLFTYFTLATSGVLQPLPSQSNR